MRPSIGTLEPIPQEEKHEASEYIDEAQELQKSLLLSTDYRISEFNLDKTTAYLDEDITVTGKFQVKYWWSWSWDSYNAGGVFLLVDNEPRYYTDQYEDGGEFKFTYTPKVMGSHNVRAVAHEMPVKTGRAELQKLSLEDKWEEMQPWIVTESMTVPVSIVERPDGNGGNDDEDGGETFFHYLTELQFSKMWKYHQEKTIALGLGATAFIVMMGGK